MTLFDAYRYDGKLELAKGDLASLQRLAPDVRPPLAVAGRFGITAEVNGTLSPFTAKVSGGFDVRIAPHARRTGGNVKTLTAQVRD